MPPSDSANEDVGRDIGSAFGQGVSFEGGTVTQQFFGKAFGDVGAEIGANFNDISDAFSAAASDLSSGAGDIEDSASDLAGSLFFGDDEGEQEGGTSETQDGGVSSSADQGASESGEASESDEEVASDDETTTQEEDDA